MNNLPAEMKPAKQDMFMPAAFQAENAFFTSIPDEETDRIFNAMSNSDYNLLMYCQDNPLEPIMMKDVLFHPVQLTDDETGEMTNCVRTVIIDIDGATYSAVSSGVIASLQRLFSVFKIQPPFADGFPITCRQVKTRNFTTIQVQPWTDPAAKAKTKKK